ncbi:xylanase [Microbacterium rhizomatis]|uniref:Xylanase n=1 Tax=Microbacterium rhizomatis TaxID=1631477 RepID=A0A5J5J1L0_9MICO|nr:xylanase [Microbacterium rhizomatis]KAA9106493.1 xylanase [Microbacterium rhizomatis]
MASARHTRYRPSARVRRRRRALAAVASAVAIIAVVAVIGLVLLPRTTPSNPIDPAANAVPTSTPTQGPAPTPPPLSPAEKLLAQTSDPAVCAVTFRGDGVTDPPVLESQGTLYQHLPIPSRAGMVFAGWYSTPQDAASFTASARVNGAHAVTCVDREITLTAAWKTPEQNVADNTRIPILMYHQFTSDPNGVTGWLRGNYAYIGDFEAQMDYIASNGFYLPTWPELAAFIDGRLSLPNHSVIITDDDCDVSWLQLAMPISIEKKLLTTAFCITVDGTGPSPSPYIQQRSHTHDMHRAGANGKGLMVNSSAADIAADLEKSAAILGAKEVVAYPFGHYNDVTKEGVREAGFEMGRTIEPGYVTIGTDKLALPVQRINYGMGVDALISAIG